jgi:hypothetical protein
MLDLDAHPDNPFRTPQWRWERAGTVLEGGPALSRKRDDAATGRAVRFRRHLQGASSPADFALLCEADAGLYWAHRLWSRRDDDLGRMAAHAIEARTLALQEPAAIARRLRIPAEAVVAYEEIFFDCRQAAADRCDDWILFNVLGQAVYRGLRAREYDLLWKLYGYHYGEHVLDALIRMAIEPARPDDPAGVQAAFADDTKGVLRIRATVAARTLTINDFTALPLLEHYRGWVEMERQGELSGGAQAGIMNNIHVMMTSLPFSVGKKDDSRVPGLPAYDEAAAELRGDELLVLAAGGEAPTLARMEALAFPPATNGTPQPVETAP